MEGTQKKIRWERPLVGGSCRSARGRGSEAGSGGTGSSLRAPPPALLSTCRSPGLGAGEGGGLCSQSRSRGH